MLLLLLRLLLYSTTRGETSCQAVVLYASPAWGFSVADKQRLDASARRATRLGLYIDATPSQLAADTDDSLFANILNNPHHVLYKFLPD